MWLSVGYTMARVERATDEELDWIADYLTFEDSRTRFSGQRTSLFNRKERSFPAGLVASVEKAGRTDGLTFEVSDTRAAREVDESADISWLRDYQRAALDAVVAGRRGIVKVPTGGGKTEIIVGLTQRVPGRWLVLAPKAQLVEQTADRFRRRVPGVVVGTIGEGRWSVPREATVVCATYQSLYADLAGGGVRSTDLLATIDGLCVDEGHTVAADTFWRVAMSVRRASYRVGFSGTPLSRGDRRNVLVVAALGPILYQIPFEVLAARGVLTRPTITMVDFRHPVYKGTSAEDGVETESPLWASVYTRAIARNEERNRLLVRACSEAPKPALLFVKELRHGRDLTRMLTSSGLRASFVWGAPSTAIREQRLRDLVAGRLDVIVCSTVFQEGIDVPELASVIVGSAGKSAIATIQRVGRGTRVAAGKTEFRVYDVADRGCGCPLSAGHLSCRWLQGHATDRRRAYIKEGYSVVMAEWPMEALRA